MAASAVAAHESGKGGALILAALFAWLCAIVAAGCGGLFQYPPDTCWPYGDPTLPADAFNRPRPCPPKDAGPPDLAPPPVLSDRPDGGMSDEAQAASEAAGEAGATEDSGSEPDFEAAAAEAVAEAEGAGGDAGDEVEGGDEGAADGQGTAGAAGEGEAAGGGAGDPPESVRLRRLAASLSDRETKLAERERRAAEGEKVRDVYEQAQALAQADPLAFIARLGVDEDKLIDALTGRKRQAPPTADERVTALEQQLAAERQQRQQAEQQAQVEGFFTGELSKVESAGVQFREVNSMGVYGQDLVRQTILAYHKRTGVTIDGPTAAKYVEQYLVEQRSAADKKFGAPSPAAAGAGGASGKTPSGKGVPAAKGKPRTLAAVPTGDGAPATEDQLPEGRDARFKAVLAQMDL